MATLTKRCSVKEDDITKSVSMMFDYEFKGTINQEIVVPNLPEDFQIGLIFGSSGSGKSTILKEWGAILIRWNGTQVWQSYLTLKV